MGDLATVAGRMRWPAKFPITGRFLRRPHPDAYEPRRLYPRQFLETAGMTGLCGCDGQMFDSKRANTGRPQGCKLCVTGHPDSGIRYGRLVEGVALPAVLVSERQREWASPGYYIPNRWAR